MREFQYKKNKSFSKKNMEDKKMSIPDKANYILYSLVYIVIGVAILRGFFKISGSSKKFPKPKRKNDK